MVWESIDGLVVLYVLMLVGVVGFWRLFRR